MIRALRLINFQKHKERVIRFDPHVTSIVGKSDSGKSSIIRALLWAVFNKAPSNLIRAGAAQAKVNLRVDEKEVIRIRDKTSNSYILSAHSQRKEFKAFGVQVPPEIADLLYMGSVNIQTQHEPPFWFFLSAPEISRQLNEIVNLGIIDQSLSRAASFVRDARSTVGVCEERLEKNQVTKSKLKYVTELHSNLQVLEARGACLEDIQKKADRLTVLAGGLENRIVLLSNAQNQLKLLEELSAAAKEFEHIQNKRQALTHHAAKIESQKNALRTASDQLGVLERQYNQHVKGQPCPLCQGKGHL